MVVLGFSPPASLDSFGPGSLGAEFNTIPISLIRLESRDLFFPPPFSFSAREEKARVSSQRGEEDLPASSPDADDNEEDSENRRRVKERERKAQSCHCVSRRLTFNFNDIVILIAFNQVPHSSVEKKKLRFFASHLCLSLLTFGPFSSARSYV